MQIGQRNVPDERRWQKRVRPKEFPIGKPHVLRIVNGPVHRWLHLWPTQSEDQATNVMKNTWRSAYVQHDVTTVLDELAKVDIALKQKHLKARGADTKDASSMLEKMDRYDYAVIPRVPGEPPSLQVFEANWTIYSQIKDKAKKADAVDPRMLMYGLCYMYDIVVTKVINERSGQNNYTVEVAPNCPTAGKIPIQHLDTEKYPIENMAQYFSAQDLELINGADWDLDALDQPVSEEELIKILVEYPIDLGRRDKINPSTFIFFNAREDFQALQSFSTTAGLPILIPTANDLVALPSQTSANALPALSPSLGTAVDAQFETVPNTFASVPAAASAPMAEKVPPTRPDPAPAGASQPAATPLQAAPAAGAANQQGQVPPLKKKPNLW